MCIRDRASRRSEALTYSDCENNIVLLYLNLRIKKIVKNIECKWRNRDSRHQNTNRSPIRFDVENTGSRTRFHQSEPIQPLSDAGHLLPSVPPRGARSRHKTGLHGYPNSVHSKRKRIMRISLFPPHPFYFHMLHAGIVFAYRWG